MSRGLQPEMAIFYFNLPSYNHIHIANYPLEMNSIKIWDNTVLARQMFCSSCRPRLKNVRGPYYRDFVMVRTSWKM